MAASNINEPALEDPTTRHGLFTKALMECLQAAPEPVSLIGSIDQVVSHVRAAAARFGREQTPVLFGHVEGAVTFPAIRAGARFAEAFPEITRVLIGGQFRELSAYGIGQPVLDLWTAKFPAGLNPLQIAAINDHGVLSRQSLLVVAPTSAGKTFVGEVAAIKAIQGGEKAVFLLPYKALVNEKYEEFSELYGRRLGLRVARCSGDWQDQTGAILRGKYDIAFFTYETFLGLVVAFPHILAQIGLVVLDEAQFINDAKRGIIVELLLTNLVTARIKGIEPQVITLSAVIGNTNAFDRWLGCRLLQATQRPVPLIEGVMDRSGMMRTRNPDGSEFTTQFLPRTAIRVRRTEASSQDMIVPLVQQLVAAGEKVIVFRNARGPAAGCAAYLAAELGLPAAQEALDLLPQLDRSSTSEKLVRCMEGGTAFHTSDLKREERALVETAFRDPNGAIKVLVATSTVAAGVNTPASTVIIVETEFFEAEGRKPYTVAQYKNMAGRAGRLGYETQGKAIMIAENSIDQNRLFRTYVSGTPEAIASSFDPNNPGTWLIRLLAQVVRVTRTQAADLLANTYGGYLKNLAQPGWQVQFQRQITALLSRMEHDGLIEAEGTDHIRLTILGNACGQSPLALELAMQMVEMLRQIAPGDLTPASLMAIVQGLPEQDDDYTPMGRGRAEANRPAEASRRFGGLIVRLLQRLAGTDAKYNARCKRALILADWIDGVPLEEIERRYTANAFSVVGHGDIRGFADATRFYLGSASRIAAIIHVEADTLHDGVETLLKQLDIGLPAAALELTDLPVNLTRGEYLALYTRGLRTIGEIRSADLPMLTEILGRRRAMEISAVFAPPAPESLSA